jgi:prepilin-type N-terminal cleavage/methylation domain-containing protein
MRERESGFTLIELMMAVAVVAILAVIALPSFFSESRKTKAFSEVQPMFNDLRVRLEQFLQENGKYPATIGEGTLHPSTAPSTTRQALNPLPVAWQDLKVRISGTDEVYCRYTWATGSANDGGNIGTEAGLFGFTAPSTEWYYLLAKCDMDGDNSAFSYYFTSSTDPTIKKRNEGR